MNQNEAQAIEISCQAQLQEFLLDKLGRRRPFGFKGRIQALFKLVYPAMEGSLPEELRIPMRIVSGGESYGHTSRIRNLSCFYKLDMLL
ncbi:MAG: hypothetical protein WBE11_19335 [Candidatus Aminicenantaceae bacterium]